jgi:hypothetical protein
MALFIEIADERPGRCDDGLNGPVPVCHISPRFLNDLLVEVVVCGKGRRAFGAHMDGDGRDTPFFDTRFQEAVFFSF